MNQRLRSPLRSAIGAEPPPDAMSRPTLRHVAERSGVSEISVSRVFRDAPHVSPALRAKVMAAAQALGFTPNPVAGALAGNATDLVAVVVPSMSNSVFPEVLDGIDSVLATTRYRTVLGISHYDLQREESLVRDLIAWNPRGIIVSGFEHTDTARRLLTRCAMPVVELMDADGTPIDLSVGVSHTRAGRLMAQHLLAAGRRRIGYIGAWGERPARSAKRRLAFERELARQGAPLVARRIEPGDSSVALGRSACAALLAEHPDLDAIFFANDDLGVGGLIHCMSAGLDVPGRIALAGFNGIALVDALPMRLTTIATPRFEMGAQAARLLLAELDGRLAGRRRKVTMPLQVRPGDTS
jgi:LacI family transcriptional regulator, gluconate utilization system Gnt-I transcriptional repressor